MLRSLFAILLLILLSFSAHAQSIQDTRGREFVLGFGENRGGESLTEETANRLSLIVVSEEAAQVRVQVNALQFDETFTVSENSELRIELPTGNNGGPTASATISEVVTPGLGVLVTSNRDIALFAFNKKLYSADAYLVWPTDRLGREYLVLSYPTSTVGSGGQFIPGQLLIVAAHDQTNVRIRTSCKTLSGNEPGSVIESVLHRGDVLLVKTARQEDQDLTGSEVLSDKPIAVYGGHVRTEVPAGTRLFNGRVPSRDHLFEQLPPVNVWGNEFVVAQFESAQKSDLVRILSRDDSNVVSVNGRSVDTLAKGQMLELTEIPELLHISTSGKSLVGQYMHTSWGELDNNQLPSYGDPSLSIVPPTSQYLERYQLVAITDSGYRNSFITVSSPTSSRASVMLDGAPLNDTLWKIVDGSIYSVASVGVSHGRHELTSDAPIGATMYAFGLADSYAMSAGAGTLPEAGVNVGISRDEKEGLKLRVHNGSLLVESPSELSLREVRILDAAGRTVLVEGLDGQSQLNLIDLSSIGPGTYFVDSRAGDRMYRGSFQLIE
jgi:hypothetical protein